METIFYIVYAAFLAVMSLLAIILYAGDKKKAKKGAWRHGNIKKEREASVGPKADRRTKYCLFLIFFEKRY